jgi:hypothetical protein
MWPLWLMTALSGAAGYISGVFSSGTVTPSTQDNQAACVSALIKNGQTSETAAQMCYGIKAPSILDGMMMPLVVLGGLAMIPITMKLMGKKKSTVIETKGW